MLNIYSEYTNPEGFIKFDDIIALALKKEIKTLGITDHGNLAGIIDVQQKALRYGIKPDACRERKCSRLPRLARLECAAWFPGRNGGFAVARRQFPYR